MNAERIGLVGLACVCMGLIFFLWQSTLHARIARIDTQLGAMSEAIHIEHVNSNLAKILALQKHHQPVVTPVGEGGAPPPKTDD